MFLMNYFISKEKRCINLRVFIVNAYKGSSYNSSYVFKKQIKVKQIKVNKIKGA